VLASRNLLGIAILEPHQVDPLSLVHFDRVVVDAGALVALQGMFE
jgi:ribosomal protein L4